MFPLQDDVEVHYFGFKMRHTHNLSDIVQEYLEPQVCGIFMPLFCYIARKNFQLLISVIILALTTWGFAAMFLGKEVWSTAAT